MQQINFDTGIQEFKINGGGSLWFNPSDPNVYSRFMDVIEEIRKVESSMEEKIRASAEESTGVDMTKLMEEVDQEVKRILSYAFGERNDFNEIFSGVNIMSVATNGEMVLTNFLNAMRPVIVKGARSFAQAQAKIIKNGQNRAQRRAAAKKS